MAKQEKKIGGPFISAAVLCQSVVEDSDGPWSAIRIIDEVKITIPPQTPPDTPSKEHPLELSIFALLIIRRGGARVGKHPLRLVVERPNGESTEISKLDVEFPEPAHGAAQVRVRLALKLHSAGLFWIDVILGRTRLTRIPLNLVIQRP